MSTPAAGPAGPAPAADGPHYVRFMLPLVLGTVLNPLNSTMLAPALPSLCHSFGRSRSDGALLITPLYVTSAIGQPLMGRLADVFSPKQVSRLGFGLVLVAALLGPLGPTFGWLIAARIVPGLGTSAAYPAAIALVQQYYEARQPPVGGAGGVAGPLQQLFARHCPAAEATRSGTFWHFARLIRALRQEGRAPKLLVLENLCGTITSNGGQDFTAIVGAFAAARYRVGVGVMDAALFVPQSRKRVFIIGVREDLLIPPSLLRPRPTALWHPVTLQRAYQALPATLRQNWLWWQLPPPPPRAQNFIDILEIEPTSVSWHSPTDTARLLSLMGPTHLEKVAQATQAGKRTVGGVYRRMRTDTTGQQQQRAEIRFDAVAGCLRTGSGGSSKQLLLVVEGELKRSRLLSPREAARLMGLPDTYRLPATYGDAYHLAGDGVVVPVVRQLAAYLLEPILAAQLVAFSLPATRVLDVTYY